MIENDNRGAVALRQCGHTYTQIAARVGAAPQTVNNWMRGHRKPGEVWRRVLAKIYEIGPLWWDEPLSRKSGQPPATNLLDVLASSPAASSKVTRPTPPPSAASDPPVGGGGVPIVVVPRTEAETLIAHIRHYRSQVETDPVLTLTEKAKVLETCSRAVERLYRLTGEVASIPEAKILASPAWGRIKDVIAAALETHPEALRAVVFALEGFAQ